MRTLHRCRRLSALVLISLLAVFQGASGQPESQSFDSSRAAAEMLPRATESLLLDITTTDSGLIAVGERGHILRSADGVEWGQVSNIPTRSTLTSVTARGDRVWAVGHDQVILHSADGGQTWQQQYASPDVFDPESNSPLLDVYFVSDTHGLAVGAYAAMLVTRNGGGTWEPSEITLAADEAEEDADAEPDPYAFDDDFVDYHLNGIVELTDGSLFLAAEQGNAYRSADGGATWTALTLPYGGSMFGALSLDDGTLLTFGLRGNAFVSEDRGDSWVQLDTQSLDSLNGAAQLASGEVLMVGVNGAVLTLNNGVVTPTELADGNDIAAVTLTDDGVILVGEGGTYRYGFNQVTQ